MCDYAVYPLATLDFSGLADQRTVYKTPLPAKPALSVGLGPYDSTWVKQADEQWLYVTGYTGMTRIKYSQASKVLEAMKSDTFHNRLAAVPIDRHGRGGLKQYDRVLPVFGGRLLDSGTGRVGRGGTPFATGLEVFDPKQLGSDATSGSVPSQTAAYISRCCGALLTLQSRMIWNGHDGSRRQEVFGTGTPNRVYVEELGAKDQALLPSNLDETIFCHEVSEHEGLRHYEAETVARESVSRRLQKPVLLNATRMDNNGQISCTVVLSIMIHCSAYNLQSVAIARSYDSCEERAELRGHRSGLP